MNGSSGLGPNIFGNMIEFVKSNLADTVAYIVLITGVILSIFDRTYFWFGQPIVGIVIGLYFARDVISWANLRLCLVEQGGFRTLLVAGFLITVAISAPMLAAGLAIGVAARTLLAQFDS